MKRFISIMLALTMLLSFAACGEKEGPAELKETVPMDVEQLKTEWKNGALVINDKEVKIPCKLSEFVEKTGLKLGNESTNTKKILKSDETLTFNVVGPEISFKITVKNVGRLEVDYKDASVVKCVFNNTTEGNRQIKFAGTLSPGAAREDVQKALGIPNGQSKDDTLYRYREKDEATGRVVELIVSFNSYDVANSVSYEIIQ